MNKRIGFVSLLAALSSMNRVESEVIPVKLHRTHNSPPEIDRPCIKVSKGDTFGKKQRRKARKRGKYKRGKS